VSRSSASPSGDAPDQAALREQFEAEVRVADIVVSADDREHLFRMWADQVPLRERLRSADLALEEEPSFIQKPAQLGAGITIGSPGPASGGPS
jgi:hypothetical protein